MISKMAALEKTGARSLVTVLEKILRDAKFELPSREVEMLYIDEFYVRDPGLQLAKLLASLPIRAKKTSVLQSNQESEIVSAEEQSHFFDFSRKFLESFQIDLQFTEGARLICLAYAKNHDSLPSFLNHHLSGIENKLRLIRHNTGRTRFVLDQVFIANPHSTLEEWLRDSAELL
jgi:hypothetical protein